MSVATVVFPYGVVIPRVQVLGTPHSETGSPTNFFDRHGWEICTLFVVDEKLPKSIGSKCSAIHVELPSLSIPMTQRQPTKTKSDDEAAFDVLAAKLV